MPDDRLRFTGTLALLAIAAAALFSSVAARADSPADVEEFENRVRPLLVEHCHSCHGPEKQKGSLRLDSRPMMIEGGDSGPSIEPGKPDESLLIQAVRRTGDLKMPPKKALSKEQVAVLERWIGSGAPWPATSAPAAATRKEVWAKHWAFQTVADPKPPEPRDAKWVRNPIDAFVKARLEAASLSPSPAADRPTLIRRASYDLTGLPPTAEEVAAFVADPDPDAFAKLVDRLLASKAYGEQWARHWLDVARYSDTKGYVYGREERFFVQSAAYRDWVVNAFNKDLPYNRFLLDQIAADQADPDDPSALAAMGFLTLGRRFLGVTSDVIDDRIDVVTRGTMGMTVGCARCHDHKFDPIPTADYYSLYGVFMNCTERTVPLAEPAVKDEAFEKELKKRRDALRDAMADSRAEASRRVRSRIVEYLLVQRDLSSVPPEGFDTILYEKDLIPGAVRRWNAYLDKLAKADDPIFRPWRRFAALDEAEFAARSAEVTRDLTHDGAPLNPLVASAFAKPPASIREVADRYGKLFTEIDWMWQEAQRASPAPTALTEPAVEGLRRVLYAADESPCYVPDEPIVTTEWFFDSSNVVKLWTLQGEVDRWLINSPQAPPHAVAVVDRAELREPRIFKRGSSANLGDEVPRRFLQVVAGPDAKPFANGSGRLELAAAIVDPGNPLTARVWVNRIWTHHFGAGLVRTPSDFGIRSEPPSHPELLDWLARRLVTEGWSTKAIHRLILLSSAYQQRSNGPDDLAVRAQAEDKDPENRLLWRMNPHRLSFEEIRDSVLAVSGELDPRMGGRAADLFASPNVRRTIYGLVDRQFLPGVLRVFDFANPDLHIPTRSETTVPQQALFAMNHEFFADRARALAARLPSDDPEAAVGFLYRAIYQRDPTPDQSSAARAFVASAGAEPVPVAPAATLAWSYGYGPVDPKSGPSKAFKPLPHYDGKGWGGGPRWPDPTLGWARITAEGGHPGDDLARSTFRRWTAPIRGEVAIDSTLIHDVAGGDGVRAWVVSSRHGVLKTAVAHNAKVDLQVAKVAVEPGDTIDFVVDVRDNLNSDQHLWSPKIRLVAPAATASEASEWDAARDFTGPPTRQLKPWEQLAQVLLMSNEFLFVD